MHRFFILGLVGLAIGLGVVLGLYKFQQPAGVVYKDSTDITSSIGGDFSLTDQFGKLRSTTEFRGKILLVYFGYTYCPDVCPMALENITKALQMLGSDRDKIAVLFISVDPSRDTVETLKLYSTNFDPNFIMLTGSESAIQNAMNKYRVYAKKENKLEFSDYLINHTSVVYVMGTDGAYLSSFAHSTSPDAIQSVLLKILQDRVSFLYK
jgi:protein SCO1/2